MTRRNHRDTGEDCDDVEVEHWHRAARLVWLGAKGQPQVEPRVGRRHQLLERQTAIEEASKTASVTALCDQRLVEGTAHDHLRPVAPRQQDGDSE